ncbi:sulfotransferase [Chroococcidiopsis sp. CCMEE 29]|uniref:sulfotransferase family protein n=1 Tax=Chroococcidiopsis sp. CCMEE 29 TaxID=155894 RepID=UPI002020A93D|nr:sulfotransferase [Chroococcidiopsis sp. CCMEE 29]
MNLNLQPLAGNSFVNWLQLLWQNDGIDRKYILRAFSISLVSFLVTPIRILENARFSKKINTLIIEEPPIFIIGHWKSGTTYFHNLMSQDKNLGYVSTIQTFAPESFLLFQRISRLILGKALPKKRAMDNIEISVDYPEEEEHAIGNMSTYGFYNCWYFPQNMRKIFNKSLLLEQVYEPEKTKWKELYMNILKKAAFNMNGKRLLLKNPANTARIKILLELFPEAKFIHIYRNPYFVYASTKNMYIKTQKLYALQDIKDEEIDDNIFFFYQKLMQKFFEDKELIPRNHLAEVKYEDFVIDPIGAIKRVYNELNLPYLEQTEENFKLYVNSQANYKANQYALDNKTLEKVERYCKFTIEKWNYKAVDVLETRKP